MPATLAPYRFDNPLAMKDEHGRLVFADYWQRELQRTRDSIAVVQTEIRNLQLQLMQGAQNGIPSTPPMRPTLPVVESAPTAPRVLIPVDAGLAALPYPFRGQGRIWLEAPLLYGTAASFTADAYPASAYSGFVFLETDTFVLRYSNGTAWTQIIAPAFLPFLGTTSSYPALKRDGTTLKVRLGDDSDDGNFETGNAQVNDTLTASTIAAPNSASMTINTTAAGDIQINAADDVALNPGGYVKFGSPQAIGAETLTDYIEIKDAAGNIIKLGVVS